MAKPDHISVMLNEALDYLNIQEGKTYVDCTLGGGGHSREILKKLNGTGHLYSFDQDINVIEKQRAEFAEEFPEWDNYTFVHSNFSGLADYCYKNDLIIDGGLLFDLGISSIQLDDPDRGFGFNKKGPLDMRMDQSTSPSAYDVVNSYKEEDLANIIYKYGDERFSRRIARDICSRRPLENTSQLAEIVGRVYYSKRKGQKSKSKTKSIHPATRTFQALRVYVNKELESLELILTSLRRFSEHSTRVVVISFQSQEDRIVKWAFREGAKTELESKVYKILTKKPALPTEDEIQENIRSRSAKLRVVEIEKVES